MRWIAPFVPGADQSLKEDDPILRCIKQLKEHGIQLDAPKDLTYDSLYEACAEKIEGLPADHPIRSLLQQKFEEHCQAVVKKTVGLVKAKVSLGAIQAYLGEERFRLAQECFHSKVREFGKPREREVKSLLTNIIEAKQASAVYQERVLALVSKAKSCLCLPFEWRLNYEYIEGVTVKNRLVKEKKRRLHLTRLCVSKEFLGQFEHQCFSGSVPTSAFPRVTLVHPSPFVLEYIDTRVNELFMQISASNLKRTEKAVLIGRLGWLEFSAVRWDRGTATNTENFLSALCLANTLRLRLDKVKAAGKRLDLEAQTTPKIDTFVELFLGFVEDLESTP